MAHVDLYEAGTWYELIEQKEQWLGSGGGVMVIPESEDKSRIAACCGMDDSADILTIPQLIERYVVRSLGREGLITLHGMESLIGSIISEDHFSYFNMEKYKQGYVKALTDFINNFRRTSFMDLRPAIEQLRGEQLSLKEKDLIKIHTAYEGKLLDYGFDLKSGLEHFLQHCSAADIHRHLGSKGDERILFFGFTYLTPLETEFILHVFKHAARTVFLYCADSRAAEPAVRIGQSVTALLKRSDGIKMTHTALLPQANNYFASLAEMIFQDDLRQMVTPQPNFYHLDPFAGIEINRENNRFSEMVSIARRIKELTGNGVSLNSMRIVAPDYDLYSTIINEVFPEYDIPFVLEEGMPLLYYPLAAVFHALINQLTGSNAYALREKIFSSPYISFASEVKAEDLLKYQSVCGVEFIEEEKLREAGRQEKQCLDFTYTKNLRIKAYRSVKPAPSLPQLQVIKEYLENLPWSDSEVKEQEKLKCLLQFYLLSLAESRLSIRKSRLSCSEFQETVLTFVQDFHIAENCRLLPGEENCDPVLKEIQRRDAAILKQVEHLFLELNACLAPLGKTDGEEFALSDFVRIFSRLMNEARFWPAKDTLPLDRVSVQPFDKGQYRQWDYTFLCGMVDGEFPREESFNFLQPKKEGLSLGLTYTSVDHGRNYLYHLLRSTSRAFYVSLPVSHNGRRLPLSPFIKELERCLAALSSELQREESKQEDAEDTLYSTREKLLCMGKNVDCNYQKALPLLKEIKDYDETLFHHLTAIMRYDGLTANSASFSQFDGFFSDNSFSLELLNKTIKSIVFTPSILERYTGCGLRFFLDDILSLRKEDDYHPDTAEKGALILSILKEYTEHAARTRDVPPDGEALFRLLLDRYLQDRNNAGEDAFAARFQKMLAAGLEEPGAKRPGLFSAFLEHEKNAPYLFKPFLSNLHGAVGLPEGLTVHVEIDRVDLAVDSDYILLYRYSTAETGDPKKIIKGLRFALPLLIMSFQKFATENELPISVGGAGVYLVKSPKSIKRGGYFALSSIRASRREGVSASSPLFSGQRYGFFKEHEFPDVLEKISEKMVKLYRMMRRGVFHLPLCDEGDQICGNCSFGRACRKNQLRLDRLWFNLKNEEDINIIEELI